MTVQLRKTEEDETLKPSGVGCGDVVKSGEQHRDPQLRLHKAVGTGER